MNKKPPLNAIVLPLCILLLSACTNPKSTQDTSQTPDTASTQEITDTADTTDLEELYANYTFTHKMMKSTGENLFASLAYECSDCTFDQHQAIETPEGWTKGPSQVLVASGGELRSTPSFDGIPDDMDFVAEVPGNEYILIAKNLDGTIIESGAGGVIVQAQVMRDTVLRFDSGRRVHELTSPDGNIFVLFAYAVNPENIEIPDWEDENFLSGLSEPEGWSYATRILDAELLLDTPDIATVLAIRKDINSTWQMR